VKNIVEEVVAREYARLRDTVDGLPDTEAFRDDVLSYALNRLPPRYVAHRTGQVVSALSMESDQERARIAVLILEAFDVVQAEPRAEI